MINNLEHIKKELEKQIKNHFESSNNLFKMINKDLNLLLTSTDDNLKKNIGNSIRNKTKNILSLNRELFIEFIQNYSINLIHKKEKDLKEIEKIYKELKPYLMDILKKI